MTGGHGGSPDAGVAFPDGDLVRSRVVTALGDALEDVLDRRLDGYAVLAPRETLLGADDEHGVLTFEDGVPALAYHAGTDRGGPAALADVATGPHRFELYAADVADLRGLYDADELRVPPAMPAERLAGDQALADRTRELASHERDDVGDAPDALEAFLENDAAVAELRESARREADRRASEWGFENAI